MKLLYFAWVRERIGTAAEESPAPASVRDVDTLLDWLVSRGGGYADALSDRQRIRVAVNQEAVGPGHPVRPGDEVAIFPPVTGGAA